MEEVRIEANSDICDYCKYRYISDEALQVRMCNGCSAYYAEHSNFRGIECTRLTKEEE